MFNSGRSSVNLESQVIPLIPSHELSNCSSSGLSVFDDFHCMEPKTKPQHAGLASPETNVASGTSWLQPPGKLQGNSLLTLVNYSYAGPPSKMK